MKKLYDYIGICLNYGLVPLNLVLQGMDENIKGSILEPFIIRGQN